MNGLMIFFVLIKKVKLFKFNELGGWVDKSMVELGNPDTARWTGSTTQVLRRGL